LNRIAGFRVFSRHIRKLRVKLPNKKVPMSKARLSM